MTVEGKGGEAVEGGGGGGGGGEPLPRRFSRAFE